MKVEFKESFLKDLRAIKNNELLTRVEELIQLVERAESLTKITNLKMLKGGGRYYRVRMGDYCGYCTRLGSSFVQLAKLTEEMLCILIAHCLSNLLLGSNVSFPASFLAMIRTSSINWLN